MIPKDNAHLLVAGKTHAGMTGKNNEDQFAVAAYQVSSADPTPTLFTIVADGIGGHLAGEVASEIAVEMISSAAAESNASQPTAILQAGILQAGRAIKAQSDDNPDQRGMGTTVITAWIIDDQLYAASVGNSRLYLLRNGVMHQVNIDHTWVQEAVDIGALTPDQARTHPNANVIRRYLGSRKPLDVDLRLRLSPNDSDDQALANQGTHLKPGDKLLLCSDGLNDMVIDEVIQGVLASTPIDQIPDEMIQLANEAGGKDNITVIAIEVPQNFKPVRKQNRGLRIPRNILFPLVGVGMLALLGLIILAIISLGILSFGGGSETALPPEPTAAATLNAPGEAAEPTTESFYPENEAATEPSSIFVLPTETPGEAVSTPVSPEIETAEADEEPMNTITPWPTNTLPPSDTTGTP